MNKHSRLKGPPVNRFVPLLALALAVALPLGASAAKHPSAATGAMSPAAVTCTPGDPVVWGNTETKVFHMAGTSYYGKTKHGKYACASDATKMGAHAAKRESGQSGSPSSGSMGGGATGGTNGSTAGTMSGGSAGAGSSSGKHHHHKRGSMMSPMPAPSPT